MGFRFRKKIKLGPLLSINLNRSTFGLGKGDGPSVTIGGKGLGVNINKKGVEGFAGVNGSGAGYRTKRKGLKFDQEEKGGNSSASIWKVLFFFVLAFNLLQRL